MGRTTAIFARLANGVRQTIRGSSLGVPLAMVAALGTAAPAGASAKTPRPKLHGVGISFRLPKAGSLADVHTFWRRAGRRCTIALHADEAGNAGAVLASAPLTDEAGWADTPLIASLAADTPYHLLVSCAGRRGRLGAVRTIEDASAGSWSLDSVHHGRVRARRGKSPLFALAFDDGSSWGQTYRPARPLRLCAGEVVRQAIVPGRDAEVTSLELATRGRRHRLTLHVTVTGGDGTVVLAAPLARHRRAGVERLRPETVASPVTLAAAQTYTVAVAAAAGRGCVHLLTHDTTLALGAPAAGMTLGDLGLSADGGRTWSARRSALALAFLDGPAGPDDGATTPPPNPGRAFRSIYASGYFGAYDRATIPVWPQRMGVVLGEADGEGPLVAQAKRVAAAAGNHDARFVFYFSLSSIDAKCDCFDSHFYEQMVTPHPTWLLRDRDGNLLSTFVEDYGAQRQFAVDVGNPAFVDAWIDWALDGMNRYGWDGVWIDNVIRGNFEGWSDWPVNPRTGAPYTTADYRRDTLQALRRIRQRFDASGKMMIGNHGSAWEADTFADPVVRQQILAMHGLEIEDCVYGFTGTVQNEGNWTAQLRYLDFANRNGVLTQCRGGNGAIGNPSRREYVLASYLLTKQGLSNVGQLNRLSDWWPQLDLDLGAPRGGFTCLDPARGLAPSAECPGTGKVYAREWQHGRVLVNPSNSATVTVPLQGALVHAGSRVTSVTLPPHSGVVLTRP